MVSFISSKKETVSIGVEIFDFNFQVHIIVLVIKLTIIK